MRRSGRARMISVRITVTPLDLPTPVEPRIAKCFEIRLSTSMCAAMALSWLSWPMLIVRRPGGRVDQPQLVARDHVGGVADRRIVRDAAAEGLAAFGVCRNLAHQRDIGDGAIIAGLIGFGVPGGNLGDHPDEREGTRIDGEEFSDGGAAAFAEQRLRQTNLGLGATDRNDMANGRRAGRAGGIAGRCWFHESPLGGRCKPWEWTTQRLGDGYLGD